VGETGTGLPAAGSEGVFAKVPASSFDAIAGNDLQEGRFVFVNDAFEKGTGFSRDEVIGRNSDEIGLSAEPGPEVIEASLAERGSFGPAPLRHRNRSGDLGVHEVHMQVVEIGSRPHLLTVSRDLKQRDRAGQELRRRDEILRAAVLSAERFLRPGSLPDRIGEVLELVGKAAGVGRACVCERIEIADGRAALDPRFEWHPPGTQATGHAPAVTGRPAEPLFPRWEEALSSGEPVHGSVRGFPPAERSVLEGQGTLSFAAVPIFVGGAWWGLMSFHGGEAERDWSRPELDALAAVGASVGAAVGERVAEERILAAEVNFRTLVEQLPSAAYMTGPLGHEANVFVSQRYEEMTALSVGRETARPAHLEDDCPSRRHRAGRC